MPAVTPARKSRKCDFRAWVEGGSATGSHIFETSRTARPSWTAVLFVATVISATSVPTAARASRDCGGGRPYRAVLRGLVDEPDVFRSLDDIPAAAQEALAAARALPFSVSVVALGKGVHRSHVLTVRRLSQSGIFAAADLRPGALAAPHASVTVEIIHDHGAAPRRRQVLFSVGGTRYRAKLEIAAPPGPAPEPRILVHGEWQEEAMGWRTGARHLRSTAHAVDEAAGAHLAAPERERWAAATRLALPLEHNRTVPAADRAALAEVQDTVTTVSDPENSARIRQVLPEGAFIRAIVETPSPRTQEILVTVGDRHYRLSRELPGTGEGPRTWHTPLTEAAATWALGGRRYEALTPEIRGYLYSPAAVGETVVMPTGARFARVSDPAFDALGPAWRDESTGLIWSERLPSKQINHEEATAFCRGHGARLPTRTEFEAWGRALGISRAVRNHLFPGVQAGNFLSSSVSPYDSNLAFGFDGEYGHIIYEYYERSYSSAYYAVRCVR